MFESALPLINSAANDLPANPVSGLQLRDIHLPGAVSWWPLAIGWWLTPLLLVLLALAFIVLRRALHKRRHSAHKKIAQAELQRIKQQYVDSADDALHSLRELSVLLRRVALSYLPREHSASLTGEAWIAQLNQLAQHKVFNQQHLELLTHGVYQPQLEADLTPLLKQCEQWLQQLPDHATARQRNER